MIKRNLRKNPQTWYDIEDQVNVQVKRRDTCNRFKRVLLILQYPESVGGQ